MFFTPVSPLPAKEQETAFCPGESSRSPDVTLPRFPINVLPHQRIAASSCYSAVCSSQRFAVTLSRRRAVAPLNSCFTIPLCHIRAFFPQKTFEVSPIESGSRRAKRRNASFPIITRTEGKSNDLRVFPKLFLPLLHRRVFIKIKNSHGKNLIFIKSANDHFDKTPLKIFRKSEF